MELLQDRLDVRNKTRANLFNWRGQFTPEFVDYVLGEFAQPDDVVVDPFSGSGTVLLECARKNLSGYGFEINPAAYAMSKFFTFTTVPQKERERLISSVGKQMLKLASKFHDLPLFSKSESYRDGYKNLLDFTSLLFSKMENRQEKVLAVNALFIAEGCVGSSLDLSVAKALKQIENSLIGLPFTSKDIRAELADARLVHEHCPVKANIIFTSPPYINVFNYHQNYRVIVEALGWDTLKVAESEIGSNRKNRGNRFKTVVQYCLDMELVLESFWKCINEEGRVVLVIGKESNVRKVPFYNGEIVMDIAKEKGGFKNITNFQRAFTNRFGINIKEDIICLTRDSTPPEPHKAKGISLRHLKSAMNIAPKEVREDLLNTIEVANTILPSPLLNSKGGFLNAKNTT